MGCEMEFDAFSFGSIRIDGITYEHDVVIDGGEVRKRKKEPSKKLRDAFGHTPLSLEEKIPWKCRRLVVGTGAHGGLPVMKEVKREAKQRKIELIILSVPFGDGGNCSVPMGNAAAGWPAFRGGLAGFAAESERLRISEA